MRYLFICNFGQNRSRTGAEICAAMGYETRYAGIYNDSRPVTRKALEWADKIFVFEDNHIVFIKEHFPGIVASKPVVNLDIKDWYTYGVGGLRGLVEEKLSEVL